ncbi:U3 snoRNP protein [Coniosporium tulheliwenetii]|uniref:U3 snoRNP protein n=1 Tax=Coniosporium tulheliwenetii TaxID=3383036 RepID=A0ACC2ZMN1_9PEZI|nr:U3 snoRNP protein [Cladosporium sp. JES 115]
MAPRRSPKTLNRPKPLEQLEDPDQELNDVEMDGASDIEKDSTEEELEKLVFGDAVGFREGIRSFAQPQDGWTVDGATAVDDEAGADGLADIADADLFFLDTGPTDVPQQALVAQPPSDDDDDDAALVHGKEAPAWEDSDDERMTVSLASVPRLRKLRRTEGEDVINGKEYARRLRRQFERLYPVPEWANPSARGPPKKKRRTASGPWNSSAEDSSSADEAALDDDEPSMQPLAELLKDADSLTRRAEHGVSRKRKLRPGVIDIQRTKDISGTQPSAITSLSIHPTLPLLLSSGPASTLYLHHINPNPPNPNPLLTSLHIKRTPLTTTAFHPSPASSQVFLSARRRYFHIWDLSTGRIEKISRVYGHQHEQRSMETFKLSLTAASSRFLAQQGRAAGCRGGIADFCWWADSKGLTIAGKNGEISEWSVEEQRTIARWTDEGAVGTTVLALGGRSGREGWLGGDRWVAVGSSSGVVNIYDRRAWSGTAQPTAADGELANGGIPSGPKPTKTFDQLTTPTSHLAFSPDGQALAMASRWKRDAMRIVHLPSCTVYKNWPTSKTPLGRITAVAWGERGNEGEAELVLAVANEQGKIRLWEVRE